MNITLCLLVDWVYGSGVLPNVFTGITKQITHTSSTCGCIQSVLELLLVPVKDPFIRDPNGRPTTCTSNMLQKLALEHTTLHSC